MFRVVKQFTFDSAHHLEWHGGKCHNLHGHTYKLEVGLKSPKLDKNGVLLDFGTLKLVVQERVIDKLDHKFLNDIYNNPTAELMAQDIYNELHEVFTDKLDFVRLWETPTSYAEVWND